MSDDVSLREFLESKLEAIALALGVAKKTVDEQMDAIKDFRVSIRNEFDIYRKKTDSDIEQLQLSKAKLEGKASQMSFNITLAISVLGIIISIISIISRML